MGGVDQQTKNCLIMKSNWMLKRLLIFVGVYFSVLILANFTGLKKGIQSHVKSLGNTAFSDFKNGGLVSFSDITEKEDKALFKSDDVLVTLKSKQQIERIKKKAKLEKKKSAFIYPTKFAVNSWLSLGMLLAFFLALVVALPANWKNKLALFISGILFLELFVYFKLWITLGLQYGRNYNKFEVGSNSESVLFVLNHVYNIINFPYFGFLLMLIFSLLFVDKTAFSKVKESLIIKK